MSLFQPTSPRRLVYKHLSRPVGLFISLPAFSACGIHWCASCLITFSWVAPCFGPEGIASPPPTPHTHLHPNLLKVTLSYWEALLQCSPTSFCWISSWPTVCLCMGMLCRWVWVQMEGCYRVPSRYHLPLLSPDASALSGCELEQTVTLTWKPLIL